MIPLADEQYKTKAFPLIEVVLISTYIPSEQNEKRYHTRKHSIVFTFRI